MRPFADEPRSRCEYLQEWIKVLPSNLGGLLNPYVVVRKGSCTASRDTSGLLVFTCLNCTQRKCCCILSGRSLGFMHHAPIYWGPYEGGKHDQPGTGTMGALLEFVCLSGLELNCCGVTWLPIICTPSSSRYQNKYLACVRSKSAASAGVLFGLLTCLVPVSHSGAKLARHRRARCQHLFKVLQLSGPWQYHLRKSMWMFGRNHA